MTIARVWTVVCVFAIACTAQAQSHHVQPIGTPDLPPGTYYALDTIRTLQIIAGAAVVAAIPGWIMLRLWMASRRAKDRKTLAMEEPWMRAKLQAMSDAERAEFLARIDK